MGKIKIDAYKCERCKHIWRPRKLDDEPRVCPKCKSPYWNVPKKPKKGDEK
jgi:Zn finger protein HypA/HybF involved in hydrogenase expression